MQIKFADVIPELGARRVISNRVVKKVRRNSLPERVRWLIQIVFDYLPVRANFRPYLTENNAVVFEKIF